MRNGLVPLLVVLVAASVLFAPTIAHARMAGDGLVPLAEMAMPAVVSVRPLNLHAMLDSPGLQGDWDDSTRADSVEEFLDAVLHLRPASGVIIDPTGLVVTTARVVEAAGSVEVVTIKGTRHRTTVVGVDRRTDIAVVRIADGGRFPVLRFGDSDRPRAGDWVVTVGSVLGMPAGVSAGIISGHLYSSSSRLDELIETDASIAPGGSGGPLLNLEGEVIGINMEPFTTESTGLGFAIPSNIVRPIVRELIETGYVSRASLELTAQPLTADLARAFGCRDAAGALVADVAPAGAAARAGIHRGDIVLGFGRTQITKAGDLSRALESVRRGQTVRITVWRDRREMTLAVTLGEEPRAHPLSAGPIAASGFSIRELAPGHGIVVTQVDAGSAASRAGIKPGDVLREVDGHDVRSVVDVERWLGRRQAGDVVVLLLQREATPLFVALISSRP